MCRIRWYGIVMYVVIAAGMVLAAEPPVSPVDPNGPGKLADYLYLAAMNNSGLQASFESFKAAMEQIPQAAALDDPQFTYGYYIREEMETRSGPHRQKYALMQTFPWFGKLQARTDAVAAQAKAAHHRFEAAKVQLIYQTSSVFYEFAYLARAIDVAKDNLELMKYFEGIVREKYRTVQDSHPDVIRAQIELALMEDSVTSLTQLRRPIIAQLNALLNRPADTVLLWPRRDDFAAVEIDNKLIADQIRAVNPELAAMQQQILASRKLVSLARKRYLPDVSLGLEVEDAPNRGPQGGRDPIMAIVSINLPIWVDSYNAGVKQALAETAMARREKIQKEFDLVAQSEQIIYDMDENLRKIRLYENVLIPRAKEMMSVTEQAYKANTVDFMSLIDAEQKLLDFRLTYERMVTDYLQKQAELEMLTGQALETKEEKQQENKGFSGLSK